MNSTLDHLYCPACGQQIPAAAGFCPECGHDLTTRTQPAGHDRDLEAPGNGDFSDGTVQVPATEPVMTACPHCDAQLPAAAQFCGSCGHSVTIEDPPTEPVSLIPTLTPEPPVAPPPTRSADAPASGRRFNGRIAAIVAAAVLVIGGGIAAALMLTGGSSSQPTKAASHKARPRPIPGPEVATPAPVATADSGQRAPSGASGLTSQVRKLDGLMQMSEQGRAAAVNGDIAAAIANRSKLLRELRTLRAQATDAPLLAALSSFSSAIRESLRQNRECGSACSADDLRNVARLKHEALSKLNPLLRKYVGNTYRREDI
jgi:Double zinc ribbon